MKRLLVVMSCAVLLSACGTSKPMPAWKPPAVKPVSTTASVYGIQQIPFRAGVSTATVEVMAKAEGCVGGLGAGLLGEPGPIETYRMVCNSQKVYMAKCEFRQCKPLQAMPAGGYGVPAAPVAVPPRVTNSPVTAPSVAVPPRVTSSPVTAPPAHTNYEPRVPAAPVAATRVATPVAAPLDSRASVATPVVAPSRATPTAARVANPVVPATTVSPSVASSPMASTATGADSELDTDSSAQPGVGGILPNHILPKLTVRWSCGECVVNDKVGPLIIEEYEKVAAHKRFTVSATETTELVIVTYHQRNNALRVLVGAGHDIIGAQITFRGKVLDATSVSNSGFTGMNKMCENMAVQTYKMMVRAVMPKGKPAAPVAPAAM